MTPEYVFTASCVMIFVVYIIFDVWMLSLQKDHEAEMIELANKHKLAVEQLEAKNLREKKEIMDSWKKWKDELEVLLKKELGKDVSKIM